jgi:hypothetical protein
MRRRLVFIALVALGSCVVVVGAALYLFHSATGLFGTVGQAIADSEDGDVLAARRVLDTAEGLTSSIGYVQRAVDAETRAATTFTASNGAVDLIPLAWSGVGSPEDPAVVDVRIEATVTAVEGALWRKGRSAGFAAECYRFTLAVTREADSERIDCPADAAPAEPPVATRPPQLPTDAEDRLRTVLSGGEVSVEAVRAVFPDPSLTVETAVTDAGEAVAAVGAPAARDCVILVRRVDGTIDPVDFRRISLEPGEAGCSTSLYTNPPF